MYLLLNMKVLRFFVTHIFAIDFFDYLLYPVLLILNIVIDCTFFLLRLLLYCSNSVQDVVVCVQMSAYIVLIFICPSGLCIITCPGRVNSYPFILDNIAFS